MVVNYLENNEFVNRNNRNVFNLSFYFSEVANSSTIVKILKRLSSDEKLKNFIEKFLSFSLEQNVFAPTFKWRLKKWKKSNS